jgi:hypothetical protein
MATEADKFKAAIHKIVHTPKAEIERREAAYQKSRKEIRARRGKPK